MGVLVVGRRVGFFVPNWNAPSGPEFPTPRLLWGWDSGSDPAVQPEPSGTRGRRTRPCGSLVPGEHRTRPHGSPETQATNAHPAKRKKTGHGTQPRAPKGRDRE